MALKVGDMAPGFTLKSSEKQDVSLSDYLGKNVVILFFPMAFTSVCTLNYVKLGIKKELYDDGLKADVLAISVDSPFTLAKFKEDQGYNFPLLSDFKQRGQSEVWSILRRICIRVKRRFKRSAFVVDKDGVIKHAEVLIKLLTYRILILLIQFWKPCKSYENSLFLTW